MGKSLRAKTKVRNRCIKRDVVYGPNEKARTERLAAKLGSIPTEDKMEADKPEEEEEKMEEDKPKISTSGWKGSRNDDFKKNHKKRQKKKNALVFKKKFNKK